MNHLVEAILNGCWPTAEVRQDEYRGAGMRAEAAGRVIRGIISATDPKAILRLISNWLTKATLILAFSSIVTVLAGCDYSEERRLRNRLSDEVGANIGGVVEILDRASYGGVEEGGDTALFKLATSDCTNIASQFGEAEPSQHRTRYYDTFARIGIKLGSIHRKIIWDTDFDPVEYVLDPLSCVLYRQAHFE